MEILSAMGCRIRLELAKRGKRKAGLTDGQFVHNFRVLGQLVPGDVFKRRPVAGSCIADPLICGFAQLSKRDKYSRRVGGEEAAPAGLKFLKPL
jgi:hypothetical protein